ncbi:DUF2332 domain-containing protein [Streptomyces sp. LP05-1]|uniref:DUF2332 domain-containing protein n=1 Tax=Streptomyces pyxinae TaxID=2970734 RepID=A0ABT2CA39_9ACTN|nr:DUF2332 domain-containing protein [Streptomyces sp. LP05-1]MCS0634265.1 DUF2332 domain-containing protein [Streptomyces sp. LP05-1]
MVDTAERYRRFAAMEARGHSPAYERLTAAIADAPPLLALIDQLPADKRQPNLLLAAVRYLDGPVDGFAAFREWTTAHWARVRATMLERRTQTNEPGRCSVLLPVLARLPQPLALIEVGASAGLCLYPDRYRYRYDGGDTLGPPDSPVVLECGTAGAVPLPARLPEIAWRAGADLNPLDVADPRDTRWLECLVWPEQHQRLARLRDAVRIARAEPPVLVRGDLNETVRDLVAAAPAGATPVVLHSAVLAYLPPEERETFTATMRELGCPWISNEAPGTLPAVDRRLPPGPGPDSLLFTLALNEHPLARTGPHGQHLEWLPTQTVPHERQEPRVRPTDRRSVN